MIMWSEITAVDRHHLLKPFLLPIVPPKMAYERTFRCSKRLLEHVGPSLEHDINQIEGPDFMIEPFAVGNLIAKLANRNDCVVLLAFKSFPNGCQHGSVRACSHY